MQEKLAEGGLLYGIPNGKRQMTSKYIHILGASGSGTTTLGRELAQKWNLTHFDSDDYYWLPTNLPYQKSRSRDERLELLQDDLQAHPKWVLSGSLCGWGDALIPHFDLIIFLWVPTKIRIERLLKREGARFGQAALPPGGNMYHNHQEFIEWAKQYDSGGLEMRSRALHENWLSDLNCKIVRFENGEAIEDILAVLTF